MNGQTSTPTAVWSADEAPQRAAAKLSVLALTRYARTGASSRVRFEQFLPALSELNIEVVVAPLLPDGYVQALQQGERLRAAMLSAYFNRVTLAMRSGRYDVLWVEKEVLPWFPAWCERSLLPAHIPIVLDYDDAVFHTYDLHRNRAVRLLLGRKHADLMRRAAVVVCGNAYLADYAQNAGAPRVEVVPTVVDTELYAVSSHSERISGCVIGWIGQRSTAAFLQPLARLFSKLRSTQGLEFHAVGIDAAALGLPMTSSPWTEATEVAAIRRFDVGIMPLPDEPFERGKCGYKLIQYMASGLPVVASPVGANTSIVKPGLTGFLAQFPDEWEASLMQLARDPGMRARMGLAGRMEAEQHYSLQTQARRLAGILIDASRRGARR